MNRAVARRARPFASLLLTAAGAVGLPAVLAVPAVATGPTLPAAGRPSASCVTHRGVVSGGPARQGSWLMSSCGAASFTRRSAVGVSWFHNSPGLTHPRLYSVVSLLAVDRNGNLAGFSQPRELNASQTWSAPLRGTARPAAGSRTVMLQAQGVLFPGAMPTRLLADPSLATQILDQALAAHLPPARVLAEFGPAAQPTCQPPLPCPAPRPVR